MTGNRHPHNGADSAAHFGELGCPTCPRGFKLAFSCAVFSLLVMGLTLTLISRERCHSGSAAVRRCAHTSNQPG